MVLAEHGMSERMLNSDRAGQRLLRLMRSEDRELLSVWSNGLMSGRAMARVMGCHSGTVTRRIKELRQRMADPVLRTLVMYERELPLKHRELAIRVLCRGEPVCKVAGELAIKRHEAQCMLAMVQGWAKGRLHGMRS